MRFSLYGFLITKPQTALHHAVWCSAVQDYLWCGAIMPFCRQFWYSFCGLYGLYGLVNTPNHKSSSLTGLQFDTNHARNIAITKMA